MVVLWCKTCGALMGMREPLTDWSTEKGVCTHCAAKLSGELPPGIVEAAKEAAREGPDDPRPGPAVDGSAEAPP